MVRLIISLLNQHKSKCLANRFCNMMEKDKLKAVNENIILDLVKVVLFVTVGTIVDYNFIYES